MSPLQKRQLLLPLRTMRRRRLNRSSIPFDFIDEDAPFGWDAADGFQWIKITTPAVEYPRRKRRVGLVRALR